MSDIEKVSAGDLARIQNFYAKGKTLEMLPHSWSREEVEEYFLESIDLAGHLSLTYGLPPELACIKRVNLLTGSIRRPEDDDQPTGSPFLAELLRVPDWVCSSL